MNQHGCTVKIERYAKVAIHKIYTGFHLSNVKNRQN